MLACFPVSGNMITMHIPMMMMSDYELYNGNGVSFILQFW